jgi:hypothetical protein
MKLGTALVLATVTGGLGFFGGWLAFHGDGVCRIEAPAEQLTRAKEAEPVKARPANPAPELEKPDSRVAIAEAAAPPAAPASEAEARRDPTPPQPGKLDPSDPRNLPESSLEEMQAKVKEVRSYLDKRTAPIILQRFEDGLAEHISDVDSWSGSGDPEWDRVHIYGLQHRPETKGWDRTVLTREQYPELYVYKDEQLRLDELIRVTEIEQAQSRQASTQPR